VQLGQRLTRSYTATAILAFNTVFVLAVLNVCAAVVLLALGISREPSEPPDVRSHASYYQGKTWARQYWTEFAASRTQKYHAYNTWRRAPFKGETINVDVRGVRATPGSSCGPGSFKIFTFGSSHMWGTGAPDWATIPAYLLASLSSVDRAPVCVENFGESGYTSTQSLITLMLRLQAGDIPDAAVFLDGAGDIYAAYQSGQVGEVHENFEMMSARVERRDRPTRPLLVQTVEQTALFRLISDQITRLRADPGGARLSTYQTAKVDASSLARSIVDTFVSNCRMAAALADEYGFSYNFFWPPHVASGSKVLTDEEQAEMRSLDPALRKLLDATYREMEVRVHQHALHVSVIDHLFDHEASPIWIDAFHTTPDGNRMIGTEMARAIREDQSPDHSVNVARKRSGHAGHSE
jgi:lysophospholipase L1-like esterase